MTFGVVERVEPCLGELMTLAVESAGHDCLVFRDLDHATRILHAIRLDAIVLDVHRPGRSGLDWLETMAATWPELPSRSHLLTNAALTPDEAVRIKALGAEVVVGAISLVRAELVVTRRLQKSRPERRSTARPRASYPHRGPEIA